MGCSWSDYQVPILKQRHTSRKMARKPQGYHALSREGSCFPCHLSAYPKKKKEGAGQPTTPPSLQPGSLKEDVFNASRLVVV